ncbi:MAG: hypothetical protein E7262_10595 [Lachnospiraceae bacterium]|nr:hypothetical protein [Lachnospiraceae bacterium]
MFKDNFGNTIHLYNEPNSSVFYVGKSGSGKTYAMKSHIIEKMYEGKIIEVYDNADSFSKEKFENVYLNDLSKLIFIDITKGNFYYAVVDANNVEDYINIILDSFIEVLVIKKDDVKLLLKELIINSYGMFKSISIEQLLFLTSMVYKGELTLSNMYGINTVRQLEYMLDSYKNISIFYMWRENYDQIIDDCGCVKENKGNIGKCCIYNMPGYSIEERAFIVEMSLAILWRKTIVSKEQNERYIVIDECQLISLDKDRSLARMLRMGRQYKIILLLATQFYSSMSKEQILTVEQVGTVVYLKPSDCEIIKIAKAIDYNNFKIWIRKIATFRRGDAVIKGSYSINDNCSIWDRPVICKIEHNRVKNRRK